VIHGATHLLSGGAEAAVDASEFAGVHRWHETGHYRMGRVPPLHRGPSYRASHPPREAHCSCLLQVLKSAPACISAVAKEDTQQGRNDLSRVVCRVVAGRMELLWPEGQNLPLILPTTSSRRPLLNLGHPPTCLERENSSPRQSPDRHG
jgi:hypothetical protein